MSDQSNQVISKKPIKDAKNKDARNKSFIEQFRQLTPDERNLWRSPMMWLATLAISFVPLAYSYIYLSSSLDPYEKLNELPVALVNLDRGTQFDDKNYFLARDIEKELEEKKQFNIIHYSTKEEAEEAVRKGKVYFALTFPQDFSKHALAGDASRHGLLHLYVSEGSNYFASRVGSNFAGQLEDEINKKLGARRWEKVRERLIDSDEKLSILKESAQKLEKGADNLEKGLIELSEGQIKLSRNIAKAEEGSIVLAGKILEYENGVKKADNQFDILENSLSALENNMPNEQTLFPLREGASKLAGGLNILSNSLNRDKLNVDKLNQLTNGAVHLDKGVASLTDGQLKIKYSMANINKQLANTNLSSLVTGAEQLNDGVATFSKGLTALGKGSQKLHSGTEELRKGSAKLKENLALLHSKLPAKLPAFTGTPEGLSASVKTVTTVFAPANNGTSFAPYFMSLSLWVGATLTTFLFPYGQLTRAARGTSQGVRVARKLLVPLLVVSIQAAVVVLGVSQLVPYVNGGEVLFVALLTSWSFLYLIAGLILMLGAAGRLVTLLALVLQLAASGGSYPIELAPVPLQTLHHYLPLTPALQAFRHAITGAYEGRFAELLGLIALGGLFGLLMLFLGRRWREVEKLEVSL